MFSVRCKILAVIGVAVLLASMGAVTATTQPPITETILRNLARADLIVIAIDNSGSIMAEGRLPTEKQYAKQIVQALSGKQFAIISFNISITVEQYPTYDTWSVLAAIDAIQDTENLTWMNGAIDRACEIIGREGKRGYGALVLATDGFPTTPDGYSRDDSAAVEATRRAAENFKNNCSILAIVGVDLKREAEEFIRELVTRDPYTGEPLFINVPSGANENFETGDFSRFPWISHGWEVTDDNPHLGWFSAKAYIGTLEITLATGEGILSFWIDSNCSGDLRLLMDGHEIGSWSDDCDWHKVEIPIHGGTHTFVWESYDYDNPYWLDDISFPVAGVGVCPCPTGLRVPQDYSTIGAAIKAASPGECINVGPGTYREELWIDKDIILCGAGADVTTIEGKITIASGAPRIEGFRITGSYSGIVVNHYTRPTIQYNIVEYNDFGILIWSLSEPTISYNVIRYNHSCGISIDEPERTTVAGTGNEIYGNGQDLCPSEAAFPPGFRK
jgi:parallel beta-helix repeat protein